MLKCRIKRGGTVWVSAKGTCYDLRTETLFLIQQVYRNIKDQNPEAAEQYRTSIIGCLLDPKSPVWNEQEANHET